MSDSKYQKIEAIENVEEFFKPIQEPNSKDNSNPLFGKKFGETKQKSIFHLSLKQKCFIFLSFLGIFSRLYSISEGKFVLWDEAHFGKFGSHYLKRDFYFDVHPPLGKMLVGLSGYLSGYDGNFEFKSGTDYPESLNYVGMRSILAMFGAFAVPLAYLTAVEMDLSNNAALLVGLMMLCGNIFLIYRQWLRWNL